MDIQKKITLDVAIWVVCTAVFFAWGLPAFSNNILALQKNHEKQLQEVQSLRSQVQSLQEMQKDLDAARNAKIQPEDFFTTDVQLVKEIQHIEQVSGLTGNSLTLTISGSADTAEQVQSKSGLYKVPYTIKLDGSFANSVTFFKYLENSYFISPVNGFSISLDENSAKKTVGTNILTNFYIQK